MSRLVGGRKVTAPNEAPVPQFPLYLAFHSFGRSSRAESVGICEGVQGLTIRAESTKSDFKRSFEFFPAPLVHSLATPSSVAQLRKAYMKKFMFTAVVLVGLTLAPKTRAAVSVDISFGHGCGYRTEPRYQAVTPYCPPPAPVYVVPNNSCELPRYDYHASHRRPARWHHHEFHRFHR